MISDNPPVSNLTSISGNVQGWSYGNLKICAVVYDSAYSSKTIMDSCIITSSGNFTLKLIAPSAVYLHKFYIPAGGFCTGNINISRADLRCAFLDIEVMDSAGSIGGNLVKQRRIDSVQISPQASNSFVYFDNNAVVTGNEYCINGLENDSNVYQLNNGKGWNAVSMTYLYAMGYKKTSISNSDTSGCSWFYKPF